MRMRAGSIVVASSLVFAGPAISSEEAGTMKIRLTVDGAPGSLKVTIERVGK
jgi:hypothetical protein